MNPEGNDSIGNGSLEKPWKTIRFAGTMAQKGDTIVLSKGIFVESLPSQLPPGVSLLGNSVANTVIKSAYFHHVSG